MKNIKIKYALIGVPKRWGNIENLKNDLQLSTSDIYLDKQYRGNIWNKFRALKDFLKTDYTHICMIDDDIKVVPNFKEAVNAFVEHFPDSIFTFYDFKIGKSECGFIKCFHVSGAGFILPKQYVAGFLSFYNTQLNGFKLDDTSLAIYAILNDIPVLLPCPKLIDVMKGYSQSTMSFRKGKENPPNIGFKDCAVDIEQVIKNGIVKTNKKINLHLPKDSKIAELCSQKGARPWW